MEVKRSRGKGHRTSTAVLVCLCSLGLLCLVAGAQAEQAQKGNLVVSFHGGISPQRLPRTEAVPVAVQMGGKIKTTDKSTPPKLERIILAINSAGKIDTTGQCKVRA